MDGKESDARQKIGNTFIFLFIMETLITTPEQLLQWQKRCFGECALSTNLDISHLLSLQLPSTMTSVDTDFDTDDLPEDLKLFRAKLQIVYDWSFNESTPKEPLAFAKYINDLTVELVETLWNQLPEDKKNMVLDELRDDD